MFRILSDDARKRMQEGGRKGGKIRASQPSFHDMQVKGGQARALTADYADMGRKGFEKIVLEKPWVLRWLKKHRIVPYNKVKYGVSRKPHDQGKN